MKFGYKINGAGPEVQLQRHSRLIQRKREIRSREFINVEDHAVTSSFNRDYDLFSIFIPIKRMTVTQVPCRGNDVAVQTETTLSLLQAMESEVQRRAEEICELREAVNT